MSHGPCNMRCLEGDQRLCGGNSIIEEEELYPGGGGRTFCSETRKLCADNSNKRGWMIEEVKELGGVKLENGRE